MCATASSGPCVRKRTLIIKTDSAFLLLTPKLGSRGDCASPPACDDWDGQSLFRCDVALHYSGDALTSRMVPANLAEP